MPQRDAWEREYKAPKLITLGEEPQKDLKRYLKFLRREEGVELDGLSVLDLGSGTGKNALYISELGNNKIVGLELSAEAVRIAQKRAEESGAKIDYRVFDIGQPYPFASASFDLALDIMTSNSLDEEARENYLAETHRVLKWGAHFFVRGLAKEGDKHAKNLIAANPGKEKDTYVIPGMELIERVFSEADFRELYGRYFEIQSLERKENYATFGGRRYKRTYFLAYLMKKP